MSFSSKVEEELSRQLSPARHCQIAKITVIINLCGKIFINKEDEYCIKIHTENVTVVRKYFTLLKRTFNINSDASIRRNAYLKKTRTYSVIIQEDGQAGNVLKACKLLDGCGEIGKNLSVVKGLVVQDLCCRQAFIRGALLAAGSVSTPEKFCHFEIVCTTQAKAGQLKNIITTFDMDVKMVTRKEYYMVYIREDDQTVNILNVMETPVALMEFENIRVVKNIRGSVNRQVNCETASINKTVSATVGQIEDITYIGDTIGSDDLPENLLEATKTRLGEPEATLKELGESFDPPMGKSGVNHRLRKLSILVEEHREKCGTPKRQETAHRNEEENYDK